MIQTPLARPCLAFEAQVSPEQAFQHDGWRQARNAVLKALADGRLAILVGPEGAGKTLLLRELERTLRAAGVVARNEWPDSAAEPAAPGVVRLVDEADLLDDATLANLALVGKATVLAVLPRSLDRMMALPGRVATTTLASLSAAECDDFVAASLAAAGRPADLFSAEAVASLAYFSEGLPGQLNQLGQASLLQAQLAEVERVQPEHVLRAAEILYPGIGAQKSLAARPMEPSPPAPAEEEGRSMAEVVPAPSARRSRRKPLLLILSGVVLALVLAASIWFLRATTPLAPSAQHSTASTDGVSPWVNRRRPELSPRRAPEEATRPAESAAAPAVPRAAPSVAAGQAPERPPLSAVDERTVPQMQGARVAPITPLAAVSPTTRAVPGADGATPGQAGSVVPPARREGPEPAQSTSLAMSGSFRGTTFNETLGRGGGLQLLVTRVGQGEAVAVQFEAFRGLVGTGQLSGRLSNDGRLVATGTLMMGANPFTTELEGTISGKQLVGTVRYTRMVAPGERPSSTQGSFRLARD